MSDFNKTERNKVRSAPVRADYNIKTVYNIIDSGLICHVGFTENDQPFVIPTIHVRIDNTIYIHGSNKSRLIKHLSKGSKVCVTVTKLDGLVLARSVFHHSMNYRSAVIFGEDFRKRGCFQKHYSKKLPGKNRCGFTVPGNDLFGLA